MKFMECRKSVLSSYNASISQQTCYEKYCEENVFLDHWEKVKPTYESNRKGSKSEVIKLIFLYLFSIKN